MFFRRVFARKQVDSSSTTTDTAVNNGAAHHSDDSSCPSDPFEFRTGHQKSTHLPHIHQPPVCGGCQHLMPHPAPQRRTMAAASPQPAVLQLTPLWEHVLQTGRLPAGLGHAELYAEFVERLRDPEWQVRQHALRVLADVLAVVQTAASVHTGEASASAAEAASAAMQHFGVLVRPLVENLGHAAPAIRRGSLDVLCAHLAVARRPHAVVEEAIRIGMKQPMPQQPQPSGVAAMPTAAREAAVASRLCAGVMLALPALVRTQRGAARAGARRQLAQMAVRALCERMTEITYQVRVENTYF